MSATRTSSPSLRRRLAWTLASVALIALVSLVTVSLSQHQARPPVPLVIKAPREPTGAAVRNEAVKPAANENRKGPRGEVAVADLPPGPKPAGKFHSAWYGYTVALSGTEWSRWENLGEVVPEAEWGALLGSYARLLILPVWLNGVDPRPEAIDYALLARLGISYPNDRLIDFQIVNHDGATGHGFRLRREVAGAPNQYQLWLLRRGEFAYLVAAWLDEAAARTTASSALDLAGLLSRISFDDVMPIAPVANALSEPQRQSHSIIYNDLGMFAFNARDYGGAIQAFRRAFELRPSDPAILMNLVNSQIELNRHREALAELDRNLGRFPDQPDLWAARAYLLTETGQIDAALAAYASLFAAGYRSEGPFAQYVALLVKNNRLDEAMTTTAGFLKAQESFAIRKLQASLYRQRGNHQQSISILMALRQNRPLDAELEYELIECFIATERFQDALQTCDELLVNRYDTAHTYWLQARCQYTLRWYTEARSSLEAVLKREPAHRDAQDLLAVIAGVLGEGSNIAVNEPIDPVAWPEQLVATASPTDGDADLKSYGACYLERRVAILFEPAKQFKLTDRRTIRVFDANGVVRFSTIQVPFDPLGEQLYVNSLRVLDDRGKQIAVGKPSDYYVIDGTRSQPATHGKLLNIPVPGLQIGRTIELVLTRSDRSPSGEFPQTAHIFSSDVPVLSAALYVRADEREIKHFASDGVKLSPLQDGLAWSIERPPVFRAEPLAQPRLAFLPHVRIGSATASWEQLVTAYLAQIADRFTTDASIEELAQKLVADAQSDEARLAALTRYVQSHLTYKAIEFGSRARIPNPAAKVLKNSYGDCKDHSLLLVQLLKAVGIEAQLVLANLVEPVSAEFPSLEQFNHMMVYAPAINRFLDCTDKDSDLLSIGVPLDLGGSTVLVLDERQPRLIELPPYAADSSRIHVARSVRLENNADASVTETVTVEGYHAAFLRNLFKAAPAANRAAILQDELSPLGGTMQIQSLDIEHLADLDKPLVFKATYAVRNRFHVVGESLLGQVPALWEQMYLGVQPLPQRRTPFAVEFPLDFFSEVELLTPAGFQAELPAGTNRQHQSKYSSWKLQTAARPNGTHIDYELHLAAGRYPASEYAAYQREFEQSMAALTQNMVLKRSE
ncbi:MAG: tetratricopeptide repeat protein [Pirellulales bacterium]|nr:tetratricopeptide repeat protein [Pirellulales bacterium]